MPPDALILAHQGGWDEALTYLAPLGLFFVLLRFANRRAAAAAPPPGEADNPPETDPDEPTPT